MQCLCSIHPARDPVRCVTGLQDNERARRQGCAAGPCTLWGRRASWLCPFKDTSAFIASDRCLISPSTHKFQYSPLRSRFSIFGLCAFATSFEVFLHTTACAFLRTRKW
ncbi:hypothetical protein IQ06DRAFT_112620 [Phaeosphaeriaceae sp. SRC1lsM3a]|nr:hypothetical protein IQ06DRAFT_112620 [Stagonospora sp. SRC1lsM3a]